VKNTRAQFRKAAEIFRPFRKQFAVITGLTLVHQSLWLLVSLVFGKLINSLLAHDPMLHALILAATTFLIALVITSISWRRGVYQEKYIDYPIDKYLIGKTLDKVLGLSLGQHRSQNTGMTQSVISKGKSSLEQAVFLVLYTIIPNMAEILLSLAFLLWFNVYVGAIVLTGTCIFIYMVYRNTQTFWPKIKGVNDLGDKTNKSYSEILGKMQLVQVNSQEERVHQEHDVRMDKWTAEGQAVWISYIMDTLPRNVVIFSLRFFVLVIGIILYYKRGLKVGDLTTIYMWTSQVSMQLWSVSPTYRQWLGLWVQIKKYFDILDVEPAIRVVDNPISIENFTGRVEFKDVTFFYPNQRYIEEEEEAVAKTVKPLLPALRNLSFVVEPGQTIAFTGPSGAGKSTLIALMLRGYDPDHGQILVDNHDLRLLDLDRFRQSVGLVEQSVELFDSTLRYNMLFSLNGKAQFVTEEEMQRLAHASRISQFEHRLTEGWDTMIGQNGVKLSGGEKQRVGIARALIKNPRLLILDEATSSLDGANERYIKDAVREASVGRTTIVIAHRLSTVRDADKIFVMDKGSIVAEGKHGELCETSSVYRELVESQLFAV
jgi:ABC-type multidrug transport system fused ATPase/permease subunit